MSTPQPQALILLAGMRSCLPARMPCRVFNTTRRTLMITNGHGEERSRAPACACPQAPGRCSRAAGWACKWGPTTPMHVCPRH